MRKAVLSLSIVLVAVCTAPGRGHAQGIPDEIWAIMNTETAVDSRGCRGCHIRPDPDPVYDAPWWGNDRLSVYLAISGSSLLDGGRDGTLSQFLHTFDMPYRCEDGLRRCWGIPDPDYPLSHAICQNELALLDNWLITFESP